MDPSGWLYSKLRSISLRKQLQEELMATGVRLQRVTRRYEVKSVTFHIESAGNGLYYKPSGKGNNLLLFVDITDVHRVPGNSTIHKKAKLNVFQHCVQVKSRHGVEWTLVCPTKEDQETWCTFLTFTRTQFQSTQKENRNLALVTNYLINAQESTTGPFSYTKTATLLNGWFGPISQAVMEKKFKELDQDKDVALTLDEFATLFLFFAQKQELLPIFKKFTATPELGMTKEEFKRFGLGQGISGTAAEVMFDAVVAGSPHDRLRIEQFSDAMVDPELNSIVEPAHKRCVDPMSLPLNCYYINSSHNTYLTSDQWKSPSSVDRYRDDLQSGCRCVEIDCWDGPDGQPIVYHGHTMTSPIRFEDVIHTIQRYAFRPPHNATDWNPLSYPVVLSLEVHTSEKQSAIMAAMMRKILGSQLLLPEENVEYTPESLRERILVKWKMNDDGDEDAKEEEGGEAREDRKVKHISKELSACATLGAVKTKKWGEDAKPTNVQSYTESWISYFREQSPLLFARQNARMLSRVYPGGSPGHLMLSSNYDPMPSWLLGVHMVALNQQKRDSEMRINEGFFANQNGGCGYVLKPEYLRSVGKELPVHPYVLNLTIISGSYLTGGRPGVGALKASAWIHGVGSETSTLPVWGDLVHPVWNRHMNLQGKHRDLDVLRIRVTQILKDSGQDDTLCEANIPVRVIRNGYRAVPLTYLKSGSDVLFASLFCHVKVETV